MSAVQKILNSKIQTYEEAVELAQEIERAEAYVKAMKEKIKEYIDSNGKEIKIETQDKVWGYYESETWEFTPQNLYKISEMIVADGKNCWEYLSLPASSIKKLDWSEDILQKYGTKKVTKRFTARKR